MRDGIKLFGAGMMGAIGFGLAAAPSNAPNVALQKSVATVEITAQKQTSQERVVQKQQQALRASGGVGNLWALAPHQPMRKSMYTYWLAAGSITDPRSKYTPHIGAKQRAKAAKRAGLA